MDLEFIVEEDIELKEFLRRKNFSKRFISKLLLEKTDIYINGTVYSKNYMLKKGDKVKIQTKESTVVKSVEKEIEIVFEDEYILVVNKPKDLVVIPSRLHYEDSLAGRVLNYLQKTKQNQAIHIVNRLDYLTSGLVIFAKSSIVQYELSKTKIQKKYLCLVDGVVEKKNGTINLKISKSNNGIKREVSDEGKPSITEYKVIKEENGKSLVEVNLLTGRTHQIRVHFSYVNHPLCGDTLYGGSEGEFFLKSYYLSFTLPLNGKHYELTIK